MTSTRRVARPGIDRRLELIAFGTILILAAALRLPDLAQRGMWDADQGHDMLVLRALLLDGRIPLLGPPTSIGDFHHGVLYYFLLAPAAALSRADPVAVTTWIAIAGIAAVAVTGWLARSIGGPAAGLLAALLLAVSASAVEESTFIWNPNLIALSSSIALAAAWRAWIGGRARWWVVAGGAAVVTMHCHVLGVILTPVIAGLLVADVRRRRRADDRDGVRAVVGAALTWLAILSASYVPLAIHELGSDASELRAVAAFLTGGAGSSAIALPVRIPIVGLRVLGWPLSGLVTTAPLASVLATGLVTGLALWRGWLAGPGEPPAERDAVRWLTLGLGWTVGALALVAASLATVVPGLPNDHYHAFADPIVVVLVAVGLAALMEPPRRTTTATLRLPSRPRTVAAAAVVVAIVGWNLSTQPPGRAADGGWVAAQAAAGRIVVAAGGGPVVLSSLPTFKSDEAVRMPLEADAARLVGAGQPATRVVLCDQLYRSAIGADCGGPAEDAWLLDPASGLASAATNPATALVDRFEAAPGRWISIYRP